MISPQRRRRFRLLLAPLLLAIACLAPPGWAGDATPIDEPNIAALVVDYGDGAVSYALVPFDGDSISGLELLERSGLDLLSISFGGMGVGICAIQDVGCDIDACRGRMCQTGDPASPYWQYLRAPDEPGSNWAYSPRGISGATVQPGDVNAWFWTGTTPASPALSVDDVATELQVELDEIRANPAPEPLLMTFGRLPGATAAPVSAPEIGIGTSILLGVAGAGGYAIWRSRRVMVQ